jgi:hypothetical protein
MLATSLLAVGLASATLRTPRSRSGAWRRPTWVRCGFIYVATLFAYLVAMVSVAACTAAVTGAMGAKGAELVAGYGANMTNQVLRARDPSGIGRRRRHGGAKSIVASAALPHSLRTWATSW